jgi:uncharacterized repeat protein (TIGR01451 family)
MTRRNLIVFWLTLSLFFLSGISLLRAQEPEPMPSDLLGKIDPRLVKQLTASDDAVAPIIIEMAEKADLSAAKGQRSALSRRGAMVAELQATAERSQAGVMAALANAAQQQVADNVRSLWIVNAVAARTGWQTVLTLAARDDVRLVRRDETINLPDANYVEAGRVAGQIEWGVERVNAPAVWNALDIDGSGVVVANMDTGVDYLHPDLRTRYRGYTGGPALHHGNWYDATGVGAVYPVDTNGHGSHTMGTIVGQNGIGVAPGATWIAVRAFDSNGVAQESWLHDAFQWFLAPGGDPALAPHIVNNSWSNNNGSLIIFEEDVQHLLDAGIIPIFSAGNNGPRTSTVGAPGSYTISLAVGATDQADEVAGFSGRGPSPWGQLKPEVSAPGVAILSTLPGGGYGLSNGTSMAAPHIAGIAALIAQAAPTLSYTDTVSLLKTSAIPLGEVSPNNNYGWGLVNAYAAVASAMDAGAINGLVSDQSTAQPIALARLTFTRHGLGNTTAAFTDEDGLYQWAGGAGEYDVTATAFGYAPKTQVGLQVMTNTALTQNFTLASLPKGTISGFVTEAGSGTPISAAILVEGSPVSAQTNPTTGFYSVALPQGSYTIIVKAPAYRIVVLPNLPVIVSQTTQQNIEMTPAPTILLVDSGAWYYGSQVGYYQNALDDAGYIYDTLQIKQIPEQTPISTTLTTYDLVIWSAPLDSPGLSGANLAMQTFLSQGGHLLVSGQDVAFYETGSFSAPYGPYYTTFLKADFITDNAETDAITAADGDIFAGLSLTISGGDGADNQASPDVIVSKDPLAAIPVLTYDTGGTAGLRVGHCLPYRAVVLPFGLEGVNNQADRVQLVANSLDWFQTPPQAEGMAAVPQTETLAGPYGGLVTHTFQLKNMAEVGPADTFTFQLGSHNWPTNFPLSNITLAPCQSARVTFTVQIPGGVDWDAQDVLSIHVRSTQTPGLQTIITRTSKAPAPILLVDDDRWFDFEDRYMAALSANGFSFDYWNIAGDPARSPPLEVLQRYPMVVWFNGYDWFDPIAPEEEARLQTYLDGGGRFSLTSQEYLYNLPDHAPSPFAQNYLGVFTHSEVLSSTLVVGLPGNPIGNQLGPYELVTPPGYQNWSDAITPTVTANRAMLSQDGLGNAITHQGGLAETWHTVFFSFGLELLDDPALAEVMRRLVGALNWLGSSTSEVDLEVATDNDLLTYTVVLKNDGPATVNTAAFTATFPPPLTLAPGSATGGASENNGQVLWSGPLAKDETLTLTYQARVGNNVPYGTMSRQVSWLEFRDQGLLFDRVAAVPVNVADFSSSRLEASPNLIGIGQIVTYTLHLTNTGLVDAPLVSVTNHIPPYLQVLTGTINSSQGSLNLSQLVDRTIIWQTPVAVNQSVAFTYAAELVSVPYPFSLTNTFSADDGFAVEQWSVKTGVIPYESYLPLIFRP